MKNVCTLLTCIALGFAVFVGCQREAKVTTTETVTGPGGSTTTTVEKTIESTGSNPPANSSGQTVSP